VIQNNTVFVVGAGASVPFKFPSGRGLLRQHKDTSADLLRGFTGDAISEAEAASLHDALRGSEDDSIDALLEYRPDLEHAGKLLIASKLLGNEEHCVDRRDWDNDWIQYLIGRMTEGARSVEAFCSGNKVTFVTYNYDRLIEFKMMNHLRVKWRASDEEQAKALKRIPVIHLHGSLGPIAPGDDRVPFGAIVAQSDPDARQKQRASLVSRAANSIRIVHQVADADEAFRSARGALTAASVVFFLGFGFGAENVRRLDFSNLPTAAPLYATRFGMTDQEYNRFFIRPLQASSRGQMLAAVPSGSAQWDCLQLLREQVGALQ
jgi:SIR2-like domain